MKTQLWTFLLAVFFVCAVELSWKTWAEVIWFESGRTTFVRPGTVHLEIEGFKFRSCRKIADSEVGYMRPVDGKWIESKFEYVDEEDNHDWPAQWRKISFGVWRWRNSAMPEESVAEVYATIAYDCGGNELVTEEIGPFKLMRVT